MNVLSFLLPRSVVHDFVNYTIFGNTPEYVDVHEYHRVSISHDRCWEKHCNKIIKKANKTLGLLRQTQSPFSGEEKSRAHQTVVLPQLEYAAVAWNPYNITTDDRLEHIQRAAARFVHHDYRHRSQWKLHLRGRITYRHWRQPKLPNFFYSSNWIFGGGAADAGNATPTFCFSVPAISKLTTLTVKSLWTAPTETAKRHILTIDEKS